MVNDRQRYKWDDETKDDRPSEFATTANSASSSGYHSTLSRERLRRKRAARRTTLMWTMLVAVGASTLLLYAVAGWLHH